MIKEEQILAIKSEKLFNNKLRVRRIARDTFYVIGYNNDKEELQHQGNAKSVAQYLNESFGYIK